LHSPKTGWAIAKLNFPRCRIRGRLYAHSRDLRRRHQTTLQVSYHRRFAKVIVHTSAKSQGRHRPTFDRHRQAAQVSGAHACVRRRRVPQITSVWRPSQVWRKTPSNEQLARNKEDRTPFAFLTQYVVQICRPRGILECNSTADDGASGVVVDASVALCVHVVAHTITVD